MNKKLMLSSLALLSAINLANAGGVQPTVVSEPIDVVAGGTLDLTTNADGYTFSNAITATSTSTDSSKKATITANKDVTFNSSFSATGNAEMTFSNVSFGNALTLTDSNSLSPTMSVSGNMIITGSGTINTGDSTISFSGDTSKLNISGASGTFTKLHVSGKETDHKLEIIYGSDNDISNWKSNTNVSAGQSALYNKLTNFTGTNTFMNDYYTRGSGSAFIGTKTGESSPYVYKFQISETEAQTFLTSDTTLHNLIEEKTTIVNNDTEPAATSVHFGTDSMTTMSVGGTSIAPNTAGNEFNDWGDATYSLSNANNNNTSYEFLMDIKPTSAKTINLGADEGHTTLEKVKFSGANQNLTVALKNSSMKTVEFSPDKSSFATINASATNEDITMIISNAESPKTFTMSNVPIMATGKSYALTCGNNVNVTLAPSTATTFQFGTITGGTNSKITVGDKATLKL